MTATASAAAVRPAVGEPLLTKGYGTAWWGMMILIGTESMVFAILLGSYFFLEASTHQWPPAGIKVPELALSLPFSFVLWGSSLPIFWADAAIRRDRTGQMRAGLLLSGLMGVAFLLYTLKDIHDLRFGWRDNAYTSAFYTIVGLHAMHVLIGVLMNGVVSVKAFQGKFSAVRHQTVDVFSLYWHFVDVVWIFVYGSLFLAVRLR